MHVTYGLAKPLKKFVWYGITDVLYISVYPSRMKYDADKKYKINHLSLL